jgi:hypothetical protein
MLHALRAAAAEAEGKVLSGTLQAVVFAIHGRMTVVVFRF